MAVLGITLLVASTLGTAAVLGIGFETSESPQEVELSEEPEPPLQSVNATYIGLSQYTVEIHLAPNHGGTTVSIKNQVWGTGGEKYVPADATTVEWTLFTTNPYRVTVDSENLGDIELFFKVEASNDH